MPTATSSAPGKRHARIVVTAVVSIVASLVVGSSLGACALGAMKDGCLVDGDCNPGRVCNAGTCGPPRSGFDGGADASGTFTDGATGNEDGSAGDGGGEGGKDGGAVVPMQSCDGAGSGRMDCGPASNESCCTTLAVAAGSFVRSYDGVGFTDNTATASVSAFHLDAFEITVGRFRKFAGAVVAGYTPLPGNGKHAHLNGGAGLNGGTESGWDAAWNAQLTTDASTWNTNLACGGGATWTSAAGANERLPITCATWFELYAFCIWDGGFLPTEAEWNYAAAGGSEQRVYPWSSPATSTTIDCTRANYASCGAVAAAAGATTAGRGRWGHADLAGNVWERTLDVDANYTTPWIDKALLAGGTDRTLRGGAFVSTPPTKTMYASFRNHAPDTSRDGIVGARCARP